MDYKNSKIYKIIDIAYTKMYIGSTTQTLTKRFSTHKSLYKMWKNGKGSFLSSYELFNEFGLDNCKIELIENYSCNSREELHRKEGEYIKQNKCVNKIISGRTDKEYYKDKGNLQRKKRYKIKRNEIIEKAKQYQKDNSSKVNEYMKERQKKEREKCKKYDELMKVLNTDNIIRLLQNENIRLDYFFV
jgi:hypothetical protein